MREELGLLLETVLALPKVEQAFIAEVILRELSDPLYQRPTDANLEWIFGMFDKFHERLKERGVDFEMAVEALVDEAYPLTPQQLAEVKRRSDEIDAGTAKCVPIEEVLQMLQERRKPQM